MDDDSWLVFMIIFMILGYEEFIFVRSFLIPYKLGNSRIFGAEIEEKSKYS